MKTNPTFLIFCILSATLYGQNLDSETTEKKVSAEVQKAIDEFNQMKRSGKELKQEVTVVLESPVPRAITVPEEKVIAPPIEKIKKPVLISGKPPEDKEASASTESPPDLLKNPPTPPSPDLVEEPGLEIRVESIRKGKGLIDPKLVKLRSSFPPKPLGIPPEKWTMVKSDNAPVFKREVELQPGTIISLNIAPHILIPEADGSETFSVNEPGFIPVEGYRQATSVSAILGKSIVQLDEDSKQIGNALSELHILLASLPQPEVDPEQITKP